MLSPRPEVLTGLSEGPALLADPLTRAGAAPPADLAAADPDRLATDPEERVRHAAASHLRLRSATLRALLADPSGHVAASTAAHPALPVAEMRALPDAAGL